MHPEQVLGVLQVEVVFYLVDAGWDGGRFESGAEVLGEVVGHADGLGAAGTMNGFHVGPGGL